MPASGAAEVGRANEPQAFACLRRDGVTRMVDDIVRPALSEQRCIVIGHSLGSIIAFKLLRLHRGAPLSFITLGSPLPLRVVRNAIGPRFGRPSSVQQWINGVDPNDAVAIGRPLTADTFGDGIDNIENVNNGRDNPHDVRKYLSDRRIADSVMRLLDA